MKQTTLIATFIMLLIATFSLTAFSSFNVKHAHAQPAINSDSMDYLLENYTDKYQKSDNTSNATRKVTGSETPNRYIYETPTVKALSYLFWAVGLYKLEDGNAVDEFMRVNECEMYKNFYSDEIEWKEIKEATRSFLRDNRTDFPTRFEFIMPLKLGDYDEKRKAFEIQDSYKIKSLRRFELYATDYKKPPCIKEHDVGKGYPRSIILEFSRPFMLTHVPLKQSEALNYIKRKLTVLKTSYNERFQTKERMYFLRDAYLVINVKVFTYGKMLGTNLRKIQTVQMMGVLEGYEIYEDIGKKNMFFAQNYVTTRSKGKLDQRLNAQYKLLRAQHEADGILR